MSPTLPSQLVDPLADPARDRSRLRFAAMLVGIGVLHFIAPRPFERIVPKWVPDARAAVLWSGVAEVAAGGLIAVPRTTRLGGWLAAATIVAVYPANVQMSIDAWRGDSLAAKVGTTLRLPMQFPMIAQALRLARGR